MKTFRLVYALIVLIASQSVWAMLDEHSFSDKPDSAITVENHAHSDEEKSSIHEQASAENCSHCCHCHSHQVSVIPLALAALQTSKQRQAVYFSSLPLAVGPPKSLFRPPIL